MKQITLTFQRVKTFVLNPIVTLFADSMVESIRFFDNTKSSAVFISTKIRNTTNGVTETLQNLKNQFLKYLNGNNNSLHKSTLPTLEGTNIHTIKDFTGFDGYDKHEKVIEIKDKSCKLRAFIAIHNTNLGPATGGTRLYPYINEKNALEDALRLSRAMTYKCALAGLLFGGGKGVIIGDKNTKNEEMLRVYGRAIETLNGLFTTGTDLGISSEDTAIMAKESRYILGQPDNMTNKKDTSHMAALGVFYAMKGALRHLYGSPEFKERSVVIKGVGKLGGELARLLVQEGARVIVADIEEEKIKNIKSLYPTVEVAHPEEIHMQVADIYSPCALGDEFNENLIKELNVKAVVGGANNQLTTPNAGDMLYKKNILYVPDYIANAGGLINIVSELESDGYSGNSVLSKIYDIEKRVLEIIKLSYDKKISPHRIADTLAERLINR